MIETLIDVLDQFFDSRMYDVHTQLPAIIESYDGHGTRKAVVKPMVNIPTIDGEFIELKPIEGVPIIFPGSNKFQQLFPIEKGDGVLLQFTECGIGNFLNGEIQVNADDLSKFTLTDCVCTPGLWSYQKVPQKTTGIGADEYGCVIGEALFRMTQKGGFAFKGQTEELVTLLVDILTQMKAFTVVTGIGPQPFTPDVIAKITTLETRLSTLKAD